MNWILISNFYDTNECVVLRLIITGVALSAAGTADKRRRGGTTLGDAVRSERGQLEIPQRTNLVGNAALKIICVKSGGSCTRRHKKVSYK